MKDGSTLCIHGYRRPRAVSAVCPDTGCAAVGGARPTALPGAILPGVTVTSYPEAGDTTLAYSVRFPGKRRSLVGVVDVADGSHRQIDVNSAPHQQDIARVPLLWVSPDGSRAIIGGFDPVTLRASPTIVLDPHQGPSVTFGKVPDGFVVDAAFSPDGSQVLFAVMGSVGQAAEPEGAPSRLAIAPASGGDPRTTAELVHLPPLLDLTWTRTTLVVSGSTTPSQGLGSIAPGSCPADPRADGQRLARHARLRRWWDAESLRQIRGRCPRPA